MKNNLLAKKKRIAMESEDSKIDDDPILIPLAQKICEFRLYYIINCYEKENASLYQTLPTLWMDIKSPTEVLFTGFQV